MTEIDNNIFKKKTISKTVRGNFSVVTKPTKILNEFALLFHFHGRAQT